MWRFPEIRPDEPEIDPTQGEFFMNEEIDRADALVRETIQNALDAARGGHDGPVRVRFAFPDPARHIVAARWRMYLDGLLPHVTAADIPGTAVPDGPLAYVVIEDFGTTGLDGQIGSAGTRAALHSVRSNFIDFWRRVGLSHKSGTERGRWGLGKTVYPNSSRLRAFLGLTVRADDGRQLLMGQSILRVHTLDGRLFNPYGFYANFDADGFQQPIEDAEILERFTEDFGVERRGEPGLSVVILSPHEDLDPLGIVRAAIQHYFHPILAGKLIVDVESGGRVETIAASTIRDVNTRIRDAEHAGLPDQLFEFIGATLEREPATTVRVPSDHAPERFDDGLLGATAVEDLRSRYAAGELIGVRVRVPVHPTRQPTAESHFDLFVRRDETLDRARDFYIRNGITVSGIRQLGSHGAIGALVAYDPVVARFLGDAENPAHTVWNERSDRFRAQYRWAVSTLRFIKSSLRALVDILARPSETRHPDLLRDIFYVTVEPDDTTPPEPGPVTPTREEEPPEPPVPPEPPTPERSPFRLSRVQGGFRISSGGGDRPSGGRVRVAYEVRRGNPFRRYDPRDFEIGVPPITIAATGCHVTVAEANRLDFRIDEPDFTMSVVGFDHRRDIRISLRPIVEDEP